LILNKILKIFHKKPAKVIKKVHVKMYFNDYLKLVQKNFNNSKFDDCSTKNDVNRYSNEINSSIKKLILNWDCEFSPLSIDELNHIKYFIFQEMDNFSSTQYRLELALYVAKNDWELFKKYNLSEYYYKIRNIKQELRFGRNLQRFYKLSIKEIYRSIQLQHKVE
jgi:hypothetical protein